MPNIETGTFNFWLVLVALNGCENFPQYLKYATGCCLKVRQIPNQNLCQFSIRGHHRLNETTKITNVKRISPK